MKKIAYLSLLSLCLFLAFGQMTSCQTHEDGVDDVLPTPEECGGAAARFNPETNAKIVNEAGDVVGYYDAKLQRYDASGTHINANTREDYNDEPGVFLYSNTGFLSNHTTTMVFMSSDYVDFKDLDGYSSVIIAPHRRVILSANRPGTSGSQEYITGSEPLYISNLGFSPDRAQIWRLNNEPVELCALGYQERCWEGVSFPFFSNQDVDLAEVAPNWDNALSSVASNDNSSCDGLMVYENNDHTTSGGDYFYLHPNTDGTFGNTVYNNGRHVNDLDENKVSRVYESMKVAHDFDHVDFPVGAVVYGRPTFAGNAALTILPKGYAGRIRQSINSYVVAPNTRIKYVNQSSTINHAGYYPGGKINTTGTHHDIELISNSGTKDQNDFFGGAYTTENYSGGGVFHTNPFVPLFKDLSFSPANNTNWGHSTTIKSIKPSSQSKVQGLVIDDPNDDYSPKLLGRINSSLLPSSIKHNRNLIMTPSSASEPVVEAEAITYDDLFNASWENQEAVFVDFNVHINVDSKSKLDQLCNKVADNCDNSYTALEDTKAFDDVVSISATGGAAFYAYCRKYLGNKAAEHYIRIRSNLLANTDLTEKQIFEAYINGLKRTFSNASRASAFENTTADEAANLLNSADMSTADGLEMTNISQIADDVALHEFVGSSESNTVRAVAGDGIEEAAGEILQAAATEAVAVGTEASVSAEILAGLATAGTVLTGAELVIGLGFVCYEVYKHLENTHDLSSHRSCNAFRQNCPVSGYNGVVNIVP